MRQTPSSSGRCAGPLLGLLLTLWATHALASPSLVIEPNPLVMPKSTTAPARADLWLHNRGDAPLVLYGVSLSPDANGYRIDDAAQPLQPGEMLLPGARRKIAVEFTPSPGRPAGYGAVLVYSSDPQGQSDPRGQTPHRVLAAGLRPQESPRLLWLWLSPLLPLLLGLVLRRQGPSAGRGELGLSIGLASLGCLPLVGVLGLLGQFVRGFGVLQGDYGVQFPFQRVIAHSLGIAYRAGLDGAALLLALALSLWGALILGPATFASRRDARGSAGGGQIPHAALALLLSAGLGALLAFDLCSLLGFFALALAAACVTLPPAWRKTLALPFAASLSALVAAAAWLWGQSLPSPLCDGVFAAHTTDLPKLSYQNYFGDLRPPTWLPLPAWASAERAGSNWAVLAYFWLAAGALLPVAALVVAILRRPLRDAGRALLLLPPLAILGFALLTRLAAGLLPQVHARFMPVWAVLAICGLALAAIRRAQPALRTTVLDQFSELVPLPTAGALLGLASATETGLVAALLLLLSQAVSATWLGIRLLHPARAARSTPAARGRRELRAPEPGGQDGLRQSLLLVLSPPGTLAALGHALCGLSAFAALRGLSVLYAVLVLGAGARSLLILLRCPSDDPGGQRPPAPGWAELGLLLASVVACFSAQPLFEVGHTWAQDFIAHTSHVSGPPGPGLLASTLQLPARVRHRAD